MHEPTSEPAERSQPLSDQARGLLRWLMPQLSRRLIDLDSEPSRCLGFSALETRCANGGRGGLLRVTVLVEALPPQPQDRAALPFAAIGLAPVSLDPETPAESQPGIERSVIRWEAK